MSQTLKSEKNKIIVKSPTQQRSRQTVNSILDACSALLIEEGFYEVTTDKIAKRAGVSVGSLYQFFGNKESVVQAVVRNLIENDKRLVSEGLPKIASLPGHQRISALLQLGIEVKRQNAELRTKLNTIQYYVSDAAYLTESIDFLHKIMKENLKDLVPEDFDQTSFLLICMFIGTLNTLTTHKPEYLFNDKVMSEISNVFLAYLESKKIIY